MTTNNDFCDKNEEKPNDYVKKSHNVAQRNSQDLTELWKKGELKAGYYYVKNEFGNIFPTDYSEEYDSINDVVIKDFWTEVSEIEEILAPVPSWEQWQQMKAFCEEFNALDVAEENQRLKELLKECKNLINECIRGDYKNELCERIDEALK